VVSNLNVLWLTVAGHHPSPSFLREEEYVLIPDQHMNPEEVNKETRMCKSAGCLKVNQGATQFW